MRVRVRGRPSRANCQRSHSLSNGTRLRCCSFVDLPECSSGSDLANEARKNPARHGKPLSADKFEWGKHQTHVFKTSFVDNMPSATQLCGRSRLCDRWELVLAADAFALRCLMRFTQELVSMKQ